MKRLNAGMIGLILSMAVIGGSPQADARLSSPGNVTFTNPNALNTAAIFDSTGTYILQFTASDGVRSTNAMVTVTVNTSVIMPKLSVGNDADIAGNTVDIPITLSTGTTGVGGVQFDLALPLGVSSNTVTAGISAINAGKSVQANVVGTALRIIVFGLNQSVMASGQVAVVNLQIGAGMVSGTLPLTLSNVSASDINGLSVPMAASGSGVLTVTANKAPTVTIVGGNQTILLPGTATLTATATDDGAPTPPGGMNFSWSVL